MSDLEHIQKIYSFSSAPVAVADKKLNIIWANNAAVAMYPSLAMPDGFRSVVSDCGALLEKLTEEKSLTFQPDSLLFSDASIFLTYLDDSALILINMPPLGTDNSRSSILSDKVTASFSNQFRSPLTIIFSAISSISRQLKKSGTSETSPVFDSLRMINKNCYNILKNCNNIVMYNRFKNSDTEYAFQRVSVSEYFGELFKALSVFTNSLYIPLEVNLEESTDILCDPDKLSLVFINLIANSCKFTRASNKITVSSKKIGNRIAFTVSDLGCGMSEDVLSHAFDPFFSYDPNMRHVASAGLGLTISKLIITAHSGTIAVESKENSGTKVVFSIPVCTEKSSPLKLSCPSADYLSDRFSNLFIHMSEISNCPMP